MKKKSIATLLLLAMIVLFTGAANADPFDQVLNRWTKTIKYIDEDKISFLEIKATYYSAEFIEAYVQKEAKDNMWTQQEMEDYKYNFLAALQMTEMIPIMIEFTNNAETMHLGPFDIMVKLGIGNKFYKPVDYDKRFNFKFQGKKEGLVFFPRFDEKTGKDLLKGQKNVTLELKHTINPSVTNGKDTKFIWTVENDDPSKLYQGKSAARFETDRLLKRLDKLRKDKAEHEKQLQGINDEISTVQKRLDELAKQ
ncbi:MAG: hypothetical protein ACOXZ3_05550 [Synergistaceae bacterium]